MSRRKYSKEELQAAVSSSHSVYEVLVKMNLSPAGANYANIKRAFSEWNIDYSHLNKRGGRRSKSYSLKEILVKDSSYASSSNLFNRLLGESIFHWECSECKIVEWQGQAAPLHLDHKNGVNTDNRLENLRFLCPNCHTQTPTYGARNIAYQKNKKGRS